MPMSQTSPNTTTHKLGAVPDSPELNFDQLAARVDELFSKLSGLTKKCSDQDIEISHLRQVNRNLQTDLKTEKTANETFQNTIKSLREALAKAKAQEVNLQKSVKQHKDSVKDQNREVNRLKSELSQSRQSIAIEQRKTAESAEKYHDAQFDLELLKCTTPGHGRTIPSEVPYDADMPLLPHPFVVVLIDGDSYTWSMNLFAPQTPGSRSNTNVPGARAAESIRSNVVKYMISHAEKIPIQSKIITRVFCNADGVCNRVYKVKNRLPVNHFMEDFMVKFTESMPLFDFFDCGRGKERADDKIRENFHLFISNPSCHKIFLATCRDNGFARMLEQYAQNPTARAKIVLVPPGIATAVEISTLGLETVEWPNVFHRLEPSQGEIRREQRILKHAQEATLRNEAFIRESGLVSPITPRSPGFPTADYFSPHTPSLTPMSMMRRMHSSFAVMESSANITPSGSVHVGALHERHEGRSKSNAGDEPGFVVVESSGADDDID